MSPEAKEIIAVLQDAALRHGIFEKRGPGEGNRITNAVMTEVNIEIRRRFGHRSVEKEFVPGVRQSVDYFLEESGEVIEVEFSLPNPYPCLEKDAFKVLLAQDRGVRISRLILVGPPGSTSRLSAPAPRAIIDLLKRKHQVEVIVVELSDRDKQATASSGDKLTN